VNHVRRTALTGSSTSGANSLAASPQAQPVAASWPASSLDTPASQWRALLHQRHLPALDGMRAIAVLIVILGHEGVHGVPPADLGVSIFFVLSGFLITWLLLLEEESTGDVSLRRFYVRRALRIFPAYFAYLAFSFTLDSVLGDMRWKHLLLPALTYTVNYYTPGRWQSRSSSTCSGQRSSSSWPRGAADRSFASCCWRSAS
jgi:peptidoglycan/LPS O-acetylase OafA/YrhL